MAKNTKEGALQTECLIYKSITDIFMTDGWDAITYGTIAKKIGLSRSGIQRVVPTKEDMLKAFQSSLLLYVTEQIEITEQIELNTPIGFKQKWHRALADKKFANCIKFYLFSALGDKAVANVAQEHMTTLYQRYGEAEVKACLGESLDYFIFGR